MVPAGSVAELVAVVEMLEGVAAVSVCARAMVASVVAVRLPAASSGMMPVVVVVVVVAAVVVVVVVMVGGVVVVGLVAGVVELVFAVYLQSHSSLAQQRKTHHRPG
jgi:hypothetical protein